MKLTKTRLPYQYCPTGHSHSLTSLSYKPQTYKQRQKQICQLVLQLQQWQGEKPKGKAPSAPSYIATLHELISLCYSNPTNQFYLCNNLRVPYREGPVTLTPIPPVFRDKTNQLIKLFQYLEKIRESYVCWLIFADEELDVLNVKFYTIYQFMDLIRDQEEYGGVDAKYWEAPHIVGLFIGQKYYSKKRAVSSIHTLNPLQKLCMTSLSNKTTKQSLSINTYPFSKISSFNTNNLLNSNGAGKGKKFKNFGGKPEKNWKSISVFSVKSNKHKEKTGVSWIGSSYTCNSGDVHKDSKNTSYNNSYSTLNQNNNSTSMHQQNIKPKPNLISNKIQIRQKKPKKIKEKQVKAENQAKTLNNDNNDIQQQQKQKQKFFDQSPKQKQGNQSKSINNKLNSSSNLLTKSKNKYF